MDIKTLKKEHRKRENKLKSRLNEFKVLPEKDWQKELFFCILTPQSQAKKCWEAVEQISALKSLSYEKVKQILKTKTRFHNNKAGYILEAQKVWNKLKDNLKRDSIIELRNWLADNVKGYGLKEASHFLRNIGKSGNQIAILDRHILKNLQKFKVIKEAKIKSKKDYLEKEQKFLDFAKRTGILPDELDLLFWSSETSEIFK